MSKLDITTTAEEKAVIVKLSGSADMQEAVALNTHLEKVLEEGNYNLVIDLSDLQFTSSMGLGSLIQTHTVCRTHQGRLALVNFLAGFLYFLGNLYWLVWVTVPGWLAASFYLAWYYVLCGFLLRGIYLQRRWPFTLVLPLVWVGQEYLRSIVMTGFPWFFLGHSQHENLRLIQICDIFGVYGVTFLVALINGLLCDLLLRPLRQGESQQRKAFLSAGPLFLLTVCCVLGTLLYG